MYANVARYYDLTHTALVEDIPYLLGLAAETGGPILELGCGSGRLLLPLLQAGHAVVGVDNSAEMLTMAQNKLAHLPAELAARAQLVAGDMRNLRLTDAAAGPFGLIVLPYNTAMHLSPGDLVQTLAGCKRYLAGNGRFLIDVSNPFTVAATPNDRMVTLENVLTDPETGDTVLQFASNWLDDVAQILHVTWLYDTTPVAGGPVSRTVAQFAYHYLFPHQWQMILADAGLNVQKMLGDYHKIPFMEESNRLIILAHP